MADGGINNDENVDLTNINRISGNLFDHSKVYPNINESLMTNSNLNNIDEQLLLNGIKSMYSDSADEDNNLSSDNDES